MDSYLTLAPGLEATAELTDRRSRFIAQLVRATSEAEAEAFAQTVRSRHHDARHNVVAWALADGRERATDDGEPQRTGGLPVLDVLRGAGLKDVCCVVTRYFGGTLLGPGGLVRAYGGAAKLAVEEAQRQGRVQEMCLLVRVVPCIPYAWYDRVRRLAEDHGGKVVDQVFTDEVQLTVDFHAGDEQGFADALMELADGDRPFAVHEPRFDRF